MEIVLKVSSNAGNDKLLKNSIAGNIIDGNDVVMYAIGADANYNAQKAIIQANGILAMRGIRLLILINYEDVCIENPDHLGKYVKTAVKWSLIKERVI